MSKSARRTANAIIKPPPCWRIHDSTDSPRNNPFMSKRSPFSASATEVVLPLPHRAASERAALKPRVAREWYPHHQSPAGGVGTSKRRSANKPNAMPTTPTGKGQIMPNHSFKGGAITLPSGNGSHSGVISAAINAASHAPPLKRMAVSSLPLLPLSPHADRHQRGRAHRRPSQ